MLTLTFLGVGSAFAKRNYHSNVLIEAWNRGPEHQAAPDDTLLVDFGGTGPMALHALKQRPGFEYLDHNGLIRYPAIRRIFITHQHADHIGGLEELALMNVFAYPQLDKPFKPQILSSISILVNLWDHSLKGGLNPRPGSYMLLQDYFFIRRLVPGEPGRGDFTLLRRYRFSLFRTDHIRIERKYDWPSYGLFIEDTECGESVFFSGDTRFDYAEYARRMEAAKICFHDVQLISQPEPIHATIGDLRTLPPEIKRRTYLYHYGDNWDAGPFDFVNDEFAGFAVPQQRMRLFD